MVIILCYTHYLTINPKNSHKCVRIFSNGAGDENRTHVRSLEGSYSTIKLHLHWLHVKDYITWSLYFAILFLNFFRVLFSNFRLLQHHLDEFLCVQLFDSLHDLYQELTEYLLVQAFRYLFWWLFFCQVQLHNW